MERRCRVSVPTLSVSSRYLAPGASDLRLALRGTPLSGWYGQDKALVRAVTKILLDSVTLRSCMFPLMYHTMQRPTMNYLFPET
jgi:hypothetical protein